MRMSVILAIAVVLVILISNVDYAFAPVQTVNQIKQELIRQSISSYLGSCPCPYNAARNGSRCGRQKCGIVDQEDIRLSAIRLM